LQQQKEKLPKAPVAGFCFMRRKTKRFVPLGANNQMDKIG